MILYFQIYLYLRAVNNTILSLGDSGVNIHKKYHGNMDMVRIYKKIHYDVGTFVCGRKIPLGVKLLIYNKKDFFLMYENNILIIPYF